MRKSIFTLVFILSTMIGYTQSFWPCVFKTGKIGIQQTNGIYKIFIQKEHTNECFVPDSTITYISIYCKESGITIGERVEVGDTLTYKLGTVIIGGSTRWYFGNNWYMCSFSSTCIFGNNYCMEEVEPIVPDVPDLPSITIQNGYVVSNVGGILLVFDWPNYYVPSLVKEFDNGFEWPVQSGQWIHVIVNGINYDLGIIL